MFPILATGYMSMKSRRRASAKNEAMMLIAMSDAVVLNWDGVPMMIIVSLSRGVSPSRYPWPLTSAIRPLRVPARSMDGAVVMTTARAFGHICICAPAAPNTDLHLCEAWASLSAEADVVRARTKVLL